MNWPEDLYEIFGAGHPTMSLVVVSLIGAFLFGGGWWVIGKKYQKRLREQAAAREHPSQITPLQPPQRSQAQSKSDKRELKSQLAQRPTAPHPQSKPKEPVPGPVATFAFDKQLEAVRGRIRYLTGYLGTRRFGLYEVYGPIGDGVLDSPQMFDQPGVIKHLARTGEIRIVNETSNNIVFEVQDKLLEK